MYCTPKKFGGAILGGGWLLMNVLFMNIHETKRCYLYYADKKMQEYTFNRE